MITTDQIANILTLDREGSTAPEIKSELRLDITVRQVQRIIAKHTPRSEKLFKQHDGARFWEGVIFSELNELGIDPKHCAVCDEDKLYLSLEGAAWETNSLSGLTPTCAACLEDKGN
jgi:hypothetical protein